MPIEGLQRAAFIDRDGVLNVDTGYVHRIEDFHWIPGSIEALGLLCAAGYACVIITNQSGIARGYYTEADVERLHTWMRNQLRQRSIELAAIYYCPHLAPDQSLPDATPGQSDDMVDVRNTSDVLRYRVSCNCRKPEPGMILRAAAQERIDLQRSCMFGDKDSDMEAGRRAGVPSRWLISDSVGADQPARHHAPQPSLLAAVRKQLEIDREGPHTATERE